MGRARADSAAMTRRCARQHAASSPASIPRSMRSPAVSRHFRKIVEILKELRCDGDRLISLHRPIDIAKRSATVGQGNAGRSASARCVSTAARRFLSGFAARRSLICEPTAHRRSPAVLWLGYRPAMLALPSVWHATSPYGTGAAHARI